MILKHKIEVIAAVKNHTTEKCDNRNFVKKSALNYFDINI